LNPGPPDDGCRGVPSGREPKGFGIEGRLPLLNMATERFVCLRRFQGTREATIYLSQKKDETLLIQEATAIQLLWWGKQYVRDL
jgi:hypothetical protein